jgi:hypothetical protein
MKTTLNLPDTVALQAKRRALEEGTTLTDIIVQGLKARLDKSPMQGPLPISRAGGGLRPGVTWETLVATDGGSEAYR